MNTSDDTPRIGDVRNIGEPLRFANVEPLAGFSAEPAKKGQQVKVWTRLALTSDEPLFHRLVKDLARVIHHMAQQAGTAVDLRRADTVLLIFKPDDSAELWVDTAAVSLWCMPKRAMKAGEVVFEEDIVDVTGMYFPCVDFGEGDKVFCLFRQDWRFGFAFDTTAGKLDIEGFTTTLGTLYRQMRYKHLYDALGEAALFDRLLATGWFPFVEIINAEFKDILSHCEAGFDIAEIEEKVVAKFDTPRTERILERWVAKPHFGAKAELLKEAITAYNNRKPISVIKILLTEIEGILKEAYRAAHDGQVAKLKDLLAFAEASAERKVGGSNTLLFPKAFGRYLNKYTFANFDPSAQTGTAGSRHAVGHGAASQESYTMVSALQAILTLDQIAFYT
uniref:Uncharacterized protein n=1 Tax=Candidatus Kentrum sp. LFY TaxID=2126342 RepID=A0A450X1J8_9GAMM|nr:MAG: hypothetical protein BECKLFY1418C_GA0070996_11344 [Candidatus Kentron sp. LFY]